MSISFINVYILNLTYAPLINYHCNAYFNFIHLAPLEIQCQCGCGHVAALLTFLLQCTCFIMANERFHISSTKLFTFRPPKYEVEINQLIRSTIYFFVELWILNIVIMQSRTRIDRRENGRCDFLLLKFFSS